MAPRPTLADHERRLQTLETAARHTEAIYGWFKNAGLDNGTGVKLRGLGDLVALVPILASLATQEQERMDDREALQRSIRVLLRFFRMETKAGKWAAGVATSLITAYLTYAYVLPHVHP